MARLLLIEDDGDTAGDVRDDLRGRGHEVAWAATGPDGARSARQGGWDAIILDRMLPGQDGLGVLQDLRRDGDRTPALVLSALGDVDERIRGLRAGGDDYLAKPFALGELAARIEALLRRPVDTRETPPFRNEISPMNWVGPRVDGRWRSSVKGFTTSISPASTYTKRSAGSPARTRKAPAE